MMLRSNERNIKVGDYDSLGLLRPVFDSHQEFENRFQSAFDGFCKKNPISAKYMLPPHFEDDTRYMALQAADCSAYEGMKLLIKQEYDPERKERR